MSEKIVVTKRAVKVWEGDEPCEITLVQKLQSVWIATGQYMGKSFEAQGRSATSAAEHWLIAARHEGK